MNTRQIGRTSIRVAAGACALAWAVIASAGPSTLTEEDVRRAASEIYVHGMTRGIADSEVGPAGVPALVRLLWDDGFEHRDNVVALLGFLGDGAVVHELIRFMASPPFSAEAPAEDRALLLIPEALGHLAARQVEPAALQTLMAITADDSVAGSDRVEMAVRGLMFSGRPEARVRLADLAENRIVPRGGFDSAAVARACLDWFDTRIAPDVSPAEPTTQREAPENPSLSFASTQATAGPPPIDLSVLDPSDVVHRTWIDYANHVNLSSAQRMSDARLDQVLDAATVLLGHEDFLDDLICCATMARTGSGRQFGSPGDGLDVLTTALEVNMVITDPTARFKVVRQIGWCGGQPLTNAIGCAHVAGYGVAVVRFGTTLPKEGALWAHEFGHNVGLTHVTDSRYVMYPSIMGNGGFSSAHCFSFHSPPPASANVPLEIGECSDSDLDGIHAVIDNCPDVGNQDQADGDGDQAGNPCDNCNGVWNPGQQDDDRDLVGDACDNCVSVANPGQADFDQDQLGDACETGATLADTDRSGRVDGFDLARLARAFGATLGDTRYEREVDLNRDSRVDGDDLSLLALYFGDQSG